MASTYSDLKIELIGTGEQVAQWGNTTNTNLGTTIEEALVGSANVSFSSADVTLTLTNTNASQTARHLRLNLTGTSGGARNLILGSGCQIDKPYIINNGLADAVTVKNTTGTGVAVPAGRSMWIFNNGTNVVEVITHVNASVTGNVTGNATNVTGTVAVANGGTGATTLTGVVKGNGTSPFTASNVNLASEVTGTLPVANGGTGATTLTANNVLLGNGTSAVQTVAPGASGNLLTSNGTTWTSTTPPTSFVTGMIILWSGSVASIPSGWALCNGSNGTPDLRNRFIVGAGSTYAVNATGGSADAIVVSHTHTASSTSAVTDPGHNHVSGTVYGGVNIFNAGGGTTSTPFTPSQINSATTGITVATTTSVNSAGSSGTNANLPPYYALAYIMKL